MRVFTALIIAPKCESDAICGNESVALEKVNNSSDGLTMLKKSHYDFAIVEFCDEVNFVNFTRDAKLNDPTLHIVAALPTEFKQLTTKLLADGADDIIQCPIDPIEFAVLLKRTSAHLAGRGSQRELNAPDEAVFKVGVPLETV